MGKTLKTISVFVAIVGMIVSLFFIKPGDGGVAGSQVSIGQSTFEKLGNKFWNEWERQKGWNEELFADNIKEIDSKKRHGNLTSGDADRLRLNVCTYALNKTDSLLCAEWKSSGCRRDVINKNFSGVVAVKKQDCLTGDARIAKLEGLHKSYVEINSLIDNVLTVQYYGVSPKLNGDGRWTDIKSRIESVKGKVDAFKLSDAYKNYFSKISTIRTAFDNATSGYSTTAKTYYTSVMDNLKKFYDDKYDSISRTDDSRILEGYLRELIVTENALRVSCRSSNLGDDFWRNNFGKYHIDKSMEINNLLEILR